MIGVLVARTEETAGIEGPPRLSGSGHAQAGCDLTAERLPVVAHITAPHGRAIALNAREAAARENHGTLVGTCSAEAFVNGLVDQQRIDITHLLASPFTAVDATACQVVVLRLCSVLPPGIDARRHEAFVESFPVGGSGSRREEVNPVGAGDIMVGSSHLTAELAILVNLRPHAQHEPHVHVVKAVGERLGIGVETFVELHGVPTVMPPPLPVLHDDAQGQVLVAEALCRFDDLLGGMKTLAAMYIAESPAREHGAVACEVVEGTDDLIGRTDE